METALKAEEQIVEQEGVLVSACLSGGLLQEAARAIPSNDAVHPHHRSPSCAQPAERAPFKDKKRPSTHKKYELLSPPRNGDALAFSPAYDMYPRSLKQVILDSTNICDVRKTVCYIHVPS